MQLDKHTRIDVDKYNYIISEEMKDRDNKWIGEYSQVSYYGNISTLLGVYAKKRHRSAVLNQSIDTLKALKVIFDDIVILGDALDIKIKNIAKHKGYTNRDLLEQIKMEK